MPALIRVTPQLLVAMLVFGVSQSKPILGQEIAIDDLQYRTPYKTVKPTITAAFAEGSSLEARKFAVLKAAETAYGKNAAKALGGSESVLARIKGGEALAKRFGVDNRSVRKGALRASRVGQSIDADPRFKLLAFDQPVYDRRGRLLTDRDIVYRHRSTGMLGRMEVKDVTPESQKSSSRKYKRQIRLMAEEQLRTGQTQAFVNRRSVIPSLHEYAAQRGVRVYENIVTTTNSLAAPNTIHINNVLEDLDRVARTQTGIRRAGLGLGVAAATLEAIQSVRAWNDYLAGDDSVLEASYHTALTGAAGSFAARGIASEILTRVNPSGRTAAILGGLKKYSTPFAVGLTGVSTGIRGYQWYSGELTTREFVTEASGNVGGLAGGLVGAWAGAGAGGYLGLKTGAVIGLFFGPEGAPIGAAIGGSVGSFVGMVGGGVAGAWAVQQATVYGVESIYSRLDATQKRELFVLLSYYYRTQAIAPQ